MCSDFVWDPTLEELRVRKLGTGTCNYLSHIVYCVHKISGRKRKHDELFTDATKDDSKNAITNTMAPPCRIVGLRGMYNMGATCFMSVILQSFIHNPLLRNFYLGDGHRTGSCVQEDCLNCGMDELFQDFYAQDTTSAYVASNILSTSWQVLQKSYATLLGDEENDAHEYFQFLTEALHITAQPSWFDKDQYGDIGEESKMIGPCNCIVHQTFYGLLQNSVTCQNCGAVTTSVQPFLDLNLGLASIFRKRAGKGGKGGQKLAQPLTLQKCLDTEYIQPEQCEYNCNSCENSEKKGRRYSTIKRLPNVLCIQFKVSHAHARCMIPVIIFNTLTYSIKRFEHHKEAKTSSKVSTKVQFPLQFNMLPYTSRARSQDTRENFELIRSCTYDLLSVVVHVGSINTGEFTSQGDCV